MNLKQDERNTSNWVEGYDLVSKQGLIHRLRTSFQTRVFDDFVTDKNSRLLDVGCGNGSFMKLLMGVGYKNVFGVEPDERLFKGNTPSNVRLGLATDLPFDDASFDVVYFFNVLHHLENLDEYSKAIDETNRVLKPGGRMILVEPAREWIYTVKRTTCQQLGSISILAQIIYGMMMEEKDLMTFFFHHHGIIKDDFLRRGYQPLRDKKFIHQWTFVAEKPN